MAANVLTASKTGRMIVVLIVLGLVVGSGWWLSKREKRTEEVVAPEIVLESSKMIKDDQKLQLPMTEADKQAIEEVFVKEGVEMTALQDVAGGQARGTAWRHFDGEKFYQKLEAENLAPLEKGFYYEGWLVGDQGFFSIGRMAAEEGKGRLYYTAEEDKSGFRGVVVTLEPEDGDPAPAEHILEGSF